MRISNFEDLVTALTITNDPEGRGRVKQNLEMSLCSPSKVAAAQTTDTSKASPASLARGRVEAFAKLASIVDLVKSLSSGDVSRRLTDSILSFALNLDTSGLKSTELDKDQILRDLHLAV